MSHSKKVLAAGCALAVLLLCATSEERSPFLRVSVVVKNGLERDDDSGMANGAVSAEGGTGWSAEDGVDLKRLNKCLERQVLYVLDKDPGSYDDSLTPLFDEHWNNFDGMFAGGSFGSGTNWAMSASKKLSYLILPKVGSMTLRSQLAICNGERSLPFHEPEDSKSSIPCDVLNVRGLQFSADNAFMNFHLPHGGFYRSIVKKNPVTLANMETRLDFPEFTSIFEENLLNSLAFTFVEDPITKFIGGFIQVEKFKGNNSPNRDLAYRKTFETRVVELSESVRPPNRQPGNPHYAPQLYYMYIAALERTRLARRTDPNTTFKAPFDYVGRMDRHAQHNWDILVDRLQATFPDAARLVNRTLAKTNGSQDYTSAEKKRIRSRADKLGLKSAYRNVVWDLMHLKAKKALGNMSKVSTMPEDLAQRLCAAFYAEYMCLGNDFPRQCTDENGNYKVVKYRKHTR